LREVDMRSRGRKELDAGGAVIGRIVDILLGEEVDASTTNGSLGISIFVAEGRITLGDARQSGAREYVRRFLQLPVVDEEIEIL
jgi:hypothetical protein